MDPWTKGSNDSLTILNIAHYLTSQQLYYEQLTINAETTPEGCNACFCKTGKVIYLRTINVDTIKARYAQIGFNQ